MEQDIHLEKTLDLIDQANQADPKSEDANGAMMPVAYLYGLRMSETLASFRPDATPALQIAARGQHIERWTVPRKSYPEGREGYLKWRSDLKRFHGRRVAELMARAGYDEADCQRVSEIVQKRNLRTDPQSQALEDVACLVFLNHYAGAFIAPHDDDKVIDILVKTLRKMSPEGINATRKLSLDERVSDLLGKAVASSST